MKHNTDGTGIDRKLHSPIEDRLVPLEPLDLGNIRSIDDLVRATAPRLMRLEARFNVRGGITTSVVAEHRKKGWRGAMPK